MSHTFEDIPYRTVDGQPLLGRLYRPSTPARATVIEVHGGAWVQNDRLTNAIIHQYLADHGVAVFAIDFRMAPQHRYPIAVQDINYAIRWFKTNRATLGLAPGKLGGLGTSSGGHLLTLAAIVPEDRRFKEDDSKLGSATASVDFLIGCWPIFDPLARYKMATARGLKNLVDNHHAFWPDEAAMAAGNPQHLVESGAATSLPPALVLQGTADENVEHERADLFVKAYRSRGGKVEYFKYTGEPHTFIVRNAGSAASNDGLERIGAFIRSQI